MNNLIEHTYTLYNNPFVLMPLILSFYKNYNGCDNDILLAYLVFPLVLHNESQKSIISSKSTSRLSKLTKNKETISGLHERINEYKQLTNICIQYAIDNHLLAINENLSVSVIGKIGTVDTGLSNAIKASSKLKNIFGKLDVISIYKLLGIKEL